MDVFSSAGGAYLIALPTQGDLPPRNAGEEPSFTVDVRKTFECLAEGSLDLDVILSMLSIQPQPGWCVLGHNSLVDGDMPAAYKRRRSLY